MKTISVLTPCYNEEANVAELYERVRRVMASVGRYKYEHIFIDNASTDNTVAVLKAIAGVDRNVKIIINSRNFGHIRSPMHAFHQTKGDAVIGLVADLQDPPEMIADMIREWENGYPIAVAVKKNSEENRLMFWLRKRYYRLVNQLSHLETYEGFTGFGLYDRKVVDAIKQFDDPYPYFRGMIAEVGFRHAELPYTQPRRTRGITKNNFYTLYDLAMLGITSLSKVPLRLATFCGFVCSALSLMAGFLYFAYKLLMWDRFSVGIAPLVIGLFFLGSVQLLFMGIVGEYVGAIHTLVQKRPLAVAQETVNFEYPPGEAMIESFGAGPKVSSASTS